MVFWIESAAGIPGRDMSSGVLSVAPVNGSFSSMLWDSGIAMSPHHENVLMANDFFGFLRVSQLASRLLNGGSEPAMAGILAARPGSAVRSSTDGCAPCWLITGETWPF